MAIKTATGAQRYNNKMDKIFKKAMEMRARYDVRRDLQAGLSAKKEALKKKMK